MHRSTNPVSREDYLGAERASPIKHELVRGEVRAVSGKGFNHAAMTGNCFVELRNRLQAKGCKPLIGDLRVHAPSGLDAYPDCSVVRGAPNLADDGTTLLNPMMIVEVVSCGTSSFDRGDKFRHYRSIPSLTDYVVVDSEEVSVEHFRRADNGEWVLRVYTDLEDRVFLPAFDETLPLSVLYQDVQLGEA
jgi:Uma2 family endonuclease